MKTTEQHYQKDCGDPQSCHFDEGYEAGLQTPIDGLSKQDIVMLSTPVLALVNSAVEKERNRIRALIEKIELNGEPKKRFWRWKGETGYSIDTEKMLKEILEELK